MTSEDTAAQHVVRTLRVLELLAEGPQTQAGVTRHLEIHRRTARRLMARLVDEGYAEAVRSGRHVLYAATPRVVVLGRKVADGLDLVAIGRRHLAPLAGPDIEACFIAVPGHEGIRVAHLEPPAKGEGRPAAALPRTGPLHATAAGKVFLAADNARLGEVLNRELLAFTSRTTVARADLLVELATVRAQRYAVEDGEHRDAVRAVASGVSNHAGITVAALGATPAAGVDLDRLGRRVREQALAFSLEIGDAMPESLGGDDMQG
jgi:DNA-binding IclR family transcriptional regulator